MKRTTYTWFSRSCSFTLAAAFLICQRGTSGDLSSSDFKTVKSLKEAVEIVREKLKTDGKVEYAALVTEDRVRRAIRSAVRSYEGNVEDYEKKTPGSKDYFLKDIKPISLRVADKGEWTTECSFFSFYTLYDKAVAYDGLGLRLQIDTPKARVSGFALPVVDLFYGRFEN